MSSITPRYQCSSSLIFSSVGASTPFKPSRNRRLTYWPRHPKQRHPQADQAAIMVPGRERNHIRLHHGYARGCPELHRAGPVPLPAGCLRVSLALPGAGPPLFLLFTRNLPHTPSSAKPRNPGPDSSQPRHTSPRPTTSRASCRSASAPSTARAPYPAPSRASSPRPSLRWTGSAGMRGGGGSSSSRA